jgi:hypothetical protein
MVEHPTDTDTRAIGRDMSAKPALPAAIAEMATTIITAPSKGIIMVNNEVDGCVGVAGGIWMGISSSG